MKPPKVIEKQEGDQALSHNNTVFSQLVILVPRHEFETLTVITMKAGSRWSQFIAMAHAQLSSRNSLRDLAGNHAAQASKLYHLGVSSAISIVTQKGQRL